MTIAFIVILSILVLMLIAAGLYRKFGWFKWLYHDVFKWHVPDMNVELFDGVSFCSRCKYCHKEIMQDSQGNWF